MATPTVTTQAASSVGKTSAVGNGNITAIGVANPTIRGFELGTAQTVDKVFQSTGDFGTGAFTETLSGLTPGQLYFYRAFATNSDGTGYGDWESFTADAATYNVTINSLVRTTDILADTINIEDTINDQQNTLTFSLIDRSGNGIPSTDQEITITLDDDTKLFGGYIVSIELHKFDNGVVQADISCVDYARLLDRNLVKKTYEDMTDKAIIQDIVATYATGLGITTANVVAGVTIDQISFNYIQPSQAIRKIADLTGRNWYIDYDKDIHYFPETTNAAPFNITSSQNASIDLRISKDASQLKNRIYVRGGTKLSEATNYITTGDGNLRKFVLPDKPHDVTVSVNRGAGYVEESVGIKNIDTTGSKWYLNFQEKYIEQDSGEVVLSATDLFKINYTYDIPILVAVEDSASIIANGQKEFAIFDNSIKTNEAARARASAELTDYANSLIEGSFRTYTDGFKSGQYLNINLSEYGINDDYIVQKVAAKSFGGGKYEYEISIASAKTMGIIRFLIELLEAQQNSLVIDNNEVVDELLELSDAILTDSIEENLTIDSTGPYFTWCPDSLVTTPVTIAIYELFQWG